MASFLQLSTTPDGFFFIVACRSISPGTCSLSRAGSAWRRLLYVTESTLAKSNQPKWESCRVSQVQSLDLPSCQHAAPTRKWKERRSRTKQKGEVHSKRDRGPKKKVMTIELSNGEYPFFSPSMHRGVLFFSPWCRHRVPAPRALVRSFRSQVMELKFIGDLLSRSASPASLLCFDPISEERAAALA